MANVTQSGAHRSKAAEKDLSIDAIPIANQISRRRLPPVSVGDLAGNPFGARMRSFTNYKSKNLTATMPQDQVSLKRSAQAPIPRQRRAARALGRERPSQ